MEIIELANKIKAVLNYDEDIEIADFSRENLGSHWDSLKHIEVVFFIQTTFGLKVKAEDLEHMNDIISIHNWLNKHV